MRLDKYLVQKHSEYSRVRIQRAIKDGEVLVNGSRVENSYLVRENDDITVSISEKHFSRELNPLQPWPDGIKVIHEEKGFVVLDKPAGISMHPPLVEKVDINKHPTLAHYLIARYPEIKSVGDNPLRPGIVHRLDKDVSGLVIVARTQNMFDHLKRQFQKRLVEKWYVATVVGRIDKSRAIKTKLTRHPRDPLKRVVSKTEGQEAITEVYPIKPGARTSVVRIKIITGRTHQIRVHLKHINHPIVGDPLYGAELVGIHLKLRSTNLTFVGQGGVAIAFSVDNRVDSR